MALRKKRRIKENDRFVPTAFYHYDFDSNKYQIKTLDERPRNCLNCEKRFLSRSRINRICEACKRREEYV